jgi:hypothetical protein
MKKPIATPDQATRLRELILRYYPSRGRFPKLAQATNITEDKWHNFWYHKQRATVEMVEAWCRAFPEDASLFGIENKDAEKSAYRFGAPRPVRAEMQTIRSRFRWVVAEWCSPVGDDRLEYLERVSSMNGQQITKKEWDDALLGLTTPSAEMMAILDRKRPHFTRWVLHGSVAAGSEDIDPGDETSCALYWARATHDWAKAKELEAIAYEELDKSLRSSGGKSEAEK